MTWTETHARRTVLLAVLDRAAADPERPLTAGDPEAERLFGSDEGMLLALQHRWLTFLAARLDDGEGEAPQAVWDDLVAVQPVLRAVLDAGARRSPALRAARRAERRMIDAYLGFAHSETRRAG